MSLPKTSKASWAADIDGLDSVAAGTFHGQTGRSYFRFTREPLTNTNLVQCDAMVTKDDRRAMLIRFPEPIAKALERQMRGNKSAAVAALVEWALQEISASGERLVIQRPRKSGRSAPPPAPSAKRRRSR